MEGQDSEFLKKQKSFHSNPSINPNTNYRL